MDTDLKKTVVKLTHNLVRKSPNRDCNFVTLIHGEDVSAEEAEEIRAAVAERLGDDAEVVLIEGKQPVYYRDCNKTGRRNVIVPPPCFGYHQERRRKCLTKNPCFKSWSR